MRKQLWLSAILIALGSVASPSWATDGPEAFLPKILVSDFNGDGAGRNRKVIFTDGKGSEVGDCGCSELRETFDVLTDDVVIVADWKLIETHRLSRNRAVATARFHVLATSNMTRRNLNTHGAWEDVRSLNAASPITDETVSYRLELRHDHWFLVDPPLPRTSIQAVRRSLQQEIDILEELMSKHPDTDPGWSSWKDGRERYREQLSVLVPLT